MSIVSTVFLLVILATLWMRGVLLASSEAKEVTVEAIYTMGDGETPSFAESMALQKAKRAALEQVGTPCARMK